MTPSGFIFIPQQYQVMVSAIVSKANIGSQMDLALRSAHQHSSAFHFHAMLFF